MDSTMQSMTVILIRHLKFILMRRSKAKILYGDGGDAMMQVLSRVRQG
jgi:uncharacterized membrane protein YecN with MAPEG domain